MKRISQKITAVLLAMIIVFSVIIPAQAASISDGGSTTATIKMGNRQTYLSTTKGSTIGGMAWEYTTNDGITGPAYCINWGLTAISPTKALPISGRYAASPQTMGAFANGFPQFKLSEFIDLYSVDYPELAGLQPDEYAYATQLAVWATLGQLAIQETNYTSGRATITRPANDAQKMRIFRAIEIILWGADSWTKPMYTGMYIQADEDDPRATVDTGSDYTLERASSENKSGIRKETIGGTEYYTRRFSASSATSTYFNDYAIHVWSENAPQGTIFTDMSNNPLSTVNHGGVTKWIAPTTYQHTTMNANGVEWISVFKLCIPASNVTDSGNVTIKAGATVRQYDIYLANNTVNSEQSYIIADPATNDLGADGALIWNSELGEGGGLVVTKVDGVGNALQGAKFTIEGPDGNKTGTTDLNGRITWTDLTPGSYVIRETQAPAGYSIVPSSNITVQDGQTSYATVRNNVEPMLYVKKQDAQNGYPLLGATFEFKQIDGSFRTTASTGHDGMIIFDGKQLPFGSYEITELQAPEGYEPDTQKQTVDWSGEADVTLTFQNVRKMGFTLIKTDANTGVSLAGAKFNVYKDGRFVTSVEVNGDGVAQVSGLSEGYYEAEETVAPQGYVLDSTRHGIYIDPYNPATDDDPVLTVANNAKPSLRIIKYDMQTMTRMADVVFEIFHDTESLGTYTTDPNGEILLFGLEPGTYLVKEISGPPSHVVNRTPQQIELHAGDTETAQLIFLNQMKPGIHIIKLDSQTMTPLVNAKFLIKKVGDSYAQEYITDQYGEIVLTALAPGAYEVLEILAPEGYLIDDEQRIIQINPDENALFVFTNTKKPVLEVLKFDGTNYLPGATFRIAKIEDGSHYLDRITDINGKIRIENLEPGIYSIKEISPPPDYILNTIEYHVELFPGRTSQLVVTNVKKPDLQIVKTDANTGLPLEGVTFTVRKVDSSTLSTVTTDDKGEAWLYALNPGVYQIIEQSVPAGYLLDDVPQLITLVGGKTGVARFQNYPRPDLYVVKTNVDGKAIPGAVFSLHTKAGVLVGDFQTDANGRIHVYNLSTGYYILTEKYVPEPFILDPAPKEIYFVEGKTTSMTIQNKRKPDLTIEKIDSITGDPIKGAKFSVSHGVNGSLNGYLQQIGTFYSDENGLIVLPMLDVGWYRVTELEPATGYQMKSPSTMDIFMTADKDQTITFENTPMSAIVVRKIDDVTGAVIPETLIRIRYMSGASGGSGTIVFEGRTSVNGTVVVPGLKSGTYIVEEVTPNPDYIMSGETSKTVFLAEDEQTVVTVELTNTRKGTIVIRKLDSQTNKPLGGAVFLITDSDGQLIGPDNGRYTTDSDGVIVIDEKFTPGTTLIVRELEPPDGYVLNDTPQTIQIQEGTSHTLTFTNTKAGGLQIIKLDAGDRQPIAGVQFEITRITGETVGTFTTDDDGIIHIYLDKGFYTLTEKSVPSPYVIDAAPRDFEIKDGQTTTIEVTNQKQASLIIRKLDSVTKEPLQGAVFSVIDSGGAPIGPDNGKYTTDKYGQFTISQQLEPGKVITVRELSAPDGYIMDADPQTITIKPDTVHTLTFLNTPVGGLKIVKLDEDTRNVLKGATFEVRRMNGELIGTYITNASGIIALPDIGNDWFTVTEVKAPDGYRLESEPHNIEVKDGKTATLEITNKKTASLMIQKTDSVTGKGIYGVTFILYDAGKNPIMQLITDQYGYAHADRELTAGKYFLKELEPAEGYEPDNEWKTIYVEAGKTTQVEWKNKPVVAQIQIVKYSSEYNPVTDAPAGSLLKGAVFEITRARSGVVVGYITTDARGVAASEPLPLGRYFIKEVTAPAYYQLSGERMEAELEYPGQIIRLSVYNKSAELGTEIKKTGNVEVIAGDSMRYDISLSNTSNTPLSDFYWSDRLPTDAARIQSLTTGTYNQRLYYRVSYKTNFSEWRILASNLLSTNNYSYNLSANALGLMSGEAVTEVKLEFGTVAAGFANLTKPTITVQTLPTLANGYQIINRCEVGGQYQGAWQTSTAAWLTKAVRYGPVPSTPSLPKTGF